MNKIAVVAAPDLFGVFACHPGVPVQFGVVRSEAAFAEAGSERMLTVTLSANCHLNRSLYRDPEGPICVRYDCARQRSRPETSRCQHERSRDKEVFRFACSPSKCLWLWHRTGFVKQTLVSDSA